MVNNLAYLFVYTAYIIRGTYSRNSTTLGITGQIFCIGMGILLFYNIAKIIWNLKD